MGDLPFTGLFRAADVQLSMSAQELLNTSDKWLDEICALPPPPPHEAQVVWVKSVKERDLGILSAFYSR